MGVGRLRICVDALMLDQEATGIGQYIRSLFEAYCVQYPDDRVWGFFQPGVEIAGVAAEIAARGVQGGRRLWYEQWGVPSRLRHAAYDVVHFPDYRVPLWRSPPRSVMTVHDLAAFVMPHVFPRSKTPVKRWLMRQSVKRASRIIVPSQATRNDLLNILNVPSEKVHVIPHGVKRSAQPLPTRVHDRPYFLAVGTIEPRKNFDGLIRAYHLLHQDRADVPDLVIAGRLGWMYDSTLALPQQLGVAEKVKFLHYVSEATLATLYRDAVCMVYPSFYEGFGLPVVEAMLANIPVVTSSQGALAELGGQFLWRADPYDIGAIATQMGMILDGGIDVRVRAQSAQEWASRLTWQIAARQTRKVYDEVAQGG